MSKSSLEWWLEQYGIELCRTHPKLKGITMRHAEDTQEATTGLIFEASRGNDRLDGPKGADVTLQISYRAQGATPEQNELVVSAIDEVFSDDYIRAHIGSTKAEKEFAGGWLQRQDDKESDRDDTKSMRKRTRRIPFIAKLS